MDVHTKKQRSFNMSKIRGADTRPEVIVTNFLNDLKIPFIKHSPSLPGKPDFYIPHFDVIIEVYGCFWHGHKNCKYFKLPSSNKVFWSDKIHSNIKRDLRNKKRLKATVSDTLIIWECEIRSGTYFEKTLIFLTRAVKKFNLKNS